MKIIDYGIVLESGSIRDMIVSHPSLGDHIESLVEVIIRGMITIESKVERIDYERIRSITEERMIHSLSGTELYEPILSKISECFKSESLRNDIRSLSDSVSRVQDGVRCVVSDKNDILLGSLRGIGEKIREMGEKVDMFSVARSASKKGQDGEKDIFDLLSDRLPSKNGYIVESVRGVVNNCDIIIKRSGYETIHIDVKNYEAGGKIRTNVVEKFRSDLIGLKKSGIMVSLWSGIVSKSDLEIEYLPTGKFGVYVSNCGYDIDRVIEMISLLHTLDTLMESDNSISLSADILERVNLIVNDNVRRLKELKSHHTSCLDIINGMNISMISSLLMNPSKEVVKDEMNPLQCKYCGDLFSSKYVSNKHMSKSCKMKP